MRNIDEMLDGAKLNDVDDCRRRLNVMISKVLAQAHLYANQEFIDSIIDISENLTDEDVIEFFYDATNGIIEGKTIN